jgi:hypothetical protein
MQFAASHPAEIETTASQTPDRRDMLSALAQIEKHAAKFECEVDTVGRAEWDRIASEFDDLNDDPPPRHSAGQADDRVSHILLRRHGRPVAGARVAIGKLPGFRRGLALLHFGPFWRRHGEAADLTIYRAALGAIVQEYCIRRGHCLTVIPAPDSELYARETKALAEFGFVVNTAGEYDYWSQPSARIIGHAIDALRGVQRTIRRWRYGA